MLLKIINCADVTYKVSLFPEYVLRCCALLYVVVWKTLKLPILSSARFPTELLSRDQHQVPCLVLSYAWKPTKRSLMTLVPSLMSMTLDCLTFAQIIWIFLLVTQTQSFEHFYPTRSIIQIVLLFARLFKTSFFPLDYSDIPIWHSIIRTFLSSAWLIQIIPFFARLFKSFLSPHDCSITLVFHHDGLICSVRSYERPCPTVLKQNLKFENQNPNINSPLIIGLTNQ